MKSKKCSVWANHEGTNTTHCTKKARRAAHAKIGKPPQRRPPKLPAKATRTPIRIAAPVARTEVEVFTAPRPRCSSRGHLGFHGSGHFGHGEKYVVDFWKTGHAGFR